MTTTRVRNCHPEVLRRIWLRKPDASEYLRMTFVWVVVCAGCAHNNVAGKKPHPYIGPTQPIAEVVSAINDNNRKLPTLWASIASNGLEASIVDDKGKRHDEVL